MRQAAKRARAAGPDLDLYGEGTRWEKRDEETLGFGRKDSRDDDSEASAKRTSLVQVLSVHIDALTWHC